MYGSHHFSECKKSRDDPVQCVNCSQNHTANYRGCEHFIALKSKLNKSNLNNKSKEAPNSELVTDGSNFPPLQSSSTAQINSHIQNHPAKSYSRVVNEPRSQPSTSQSSTESSFNIDLIDSTSLKHFFA